MLVVRVVDAHDKGGDVALARRGDEDLLSARLDVLARAGLVHEDAGALNDEVDAQVAPGQLRGVAVGHDLDRAAVDGDGAVAVDLRAADAVRRAGRALGSVRGERLRRRQRKIRKKQQVRALAKIRCVHAGAVFRRAGRARTGRRSAALT